MGFAKFRIGHAGAHRKLGSQQHTPRANTPDASCKTGGFYQAPTSSQSIDSLQPLNIKWDNTCLNTQKADIWLYAPSAVQSRLALWKNVDFTTGSVTVNLMPRWWNSTSSINLQLGIVPAGQAPFQSSDMPAGPVFTATYSKPSSGETPAAADTSIKTQPVMDMSQQQNQSHHLSSGKTAAAVLIPLLLVIGAAAYAYIRWQRKKAEEKTKRFSVKVDQRMSTMSTDWKPVTAAGANAAIRNSMAVGGNRSSSFSFGAIRPVSTFNPDENNQAGVGVGAMGSPRQMSQMSTGVGLRNPSNSVSYPSERVSRVSFADTVNRQSRVSFANDPRPSTDSGRRGMRAYHEGYVPPVPELPPSAVIAGASTSHSNEKGGSPSSPSSEEGALSPRQTQGALTLTPEDIRARMRSRSASNASAPAKEDEEREDAYDDVLPALSMMRTDQSEEFLLPSPPPQAHAPLHNDNYPVSPMSPPPSYSYTSAAPIASPTSPPPMMMSSMMGTMPMPANVMSPDEMLRAYAERKRANATPVSVVGNGYNMTMAPSPPPIASPPMAATGLPNAYAAGIMSPQNTGRELTGHGKKGSVGVGAYGGARYEIGEDEEPYGGTAW